MDANSDASKQSDAPDEAMTTDGCNNGQIRLLVKTARVQKFIEVDEGSSIREVSIALVQMFMCFASLRTLTIFESIPVTPFIASTQSCQRLRSWRSTVNSSHLRGQDPQGS